MLSQDVMPTTRRLKFKTQKLNHKQACTSKHLVTNRYALYSGGSAKLLKRPTRHKRKGRGRIKEFATMGMQSREIATAIAVVPLVLVWQGGT